MIVRAQVNGRGVTALHVGTNNVRRFFPSRIPAIELDLGHLKIQCELHPGFWQDEPEIRDHRLCTWLETKRRQSKSGGRPIYLAMIPTQPNSFRLQPVSLETQIRSKISQPSCYLRPVCIAPASQCSNHGVSPGRSTSGSPLRHPITSPVL
jgi:hypothetical protein